MQCLRTACMAKLYIVHNFVETQYPDARTHAQLYNFSVIIPGDLELESVFVVMVAVKNEPVHCLLVEVPVIYITIMG